MKKLVTMFTALVLALTLMVGMAGAVMASENVLEGDKPVDLFHFIRNQRLRWAIHNYVKELRRFRFHTRQLAHYVKGGIRR